MSAATVADVVDRWRPLSDIEEIRALALLGDAWELLKLKVTDLQLRINATTLSTGLVVMVQTAMVIRVLRNPEGKRQEAIEDYSYTMHDDSASGLLTITADELALLAPAFAGAAGAFTITPYFSPTWVPL